MICSPIIRYVFTSLRFERSIRLDCRKRVFLSLTFLDTAPGSPWLPWQPFPWQPIIRWGREQSQRHQDRTDWKLKIRYLPAHVFDTFELSMHTIKIRNIWNVLTSDESQIWRWFSACQSQELNYEVTEFFVIIMSKSTLGPKWVNWAMTEPFSHTFSPRPCCFFTLAKENAMAIMAITQR